MDADAPSLTDCGAWTAVRRSGSHSSALRSDGLELTEIASGIELERDVFAHIGVTPIIQRAEAGGRQALSRRANGGQACLGSRRLSSSGSRRVTAGASS